MIVQTIVIAMQKIASAIVHAKKITGVRLRFRNNISNGNKMHMERMDSVSAPIFCINVNIIIDTMLKFDTNTDANVNIDVTCDRTFSNSDNVMNTKRLNG